MTNSQRPEVVTYRFNGKMVYVTPAKDYEQALDFAQNVFPEELRHIKRDHISFSVLSVAQRKQQTARIAAMAWTAVVGNLKTYEIIDLHVQPQFYVEDVDAPPAYPKPIQLEDSKEAAEFYRRPKSVPASRTHSRQTSPSAHSTHSTGKGSKNWFRLK
jgi:hypothetical protein